MIFIAARTLCKSLYSIHIYICCSSWLQFIFRGRHPAGWILRLDCATEGSARKTRKQRCPLPRLFPASALTLVRLIHCSASVTPEHSASFTAHSVWGRDVALPCGRYGWALDKCGLHETYLYKLALWVGGPVHVVNIGPRLSQGCLISRGQYIWNSMWLQQAESMTQIFATIEQKCATSRNWGLCPRVSLSPRLAGLNADARHSNFWFRDVPRFSRGERHLYRNAHARATNGNYFLWSDSRESDVSADASAAHFVGFSGRSRRSTMFCLASSPPTPPRTLCCAVIDEFNIHWQPWCHAPLTRALGPALGPLFQWKPGARDQIPDHLPDGEKSVFIDWGRNSRLSQSH